MTPVDGSDERRDESRAATAARLDAAATFQREVLADAASRASACAP